MSNLAERIWQQNQQAIFNSAFVPETVAGVRTALDEDGVRVVHMAAAVVVLDEYEQAGNQVAEVWGPYLMGKENLAQALASTLKKIKAGTSVQFFVDQANLLLPLLKARGFRFSQHTTWQVRPLPPATHAVTRYTSVPTQDVQAQVARMQMDNHFSDREIAAATTAERPFFTVMAGSRVQGYAQGEVGEDDEGHILYVVVAPEARRQGIARSLLASASTDLFKRGATSVTLVQAATASAAAATYQSCGFTPLRTVVSASLTLP